MGSGLHSESSPEEISRAASWFRSCLVTRWPLLLLHAWSCSLAEPNPLLHHTARG